MKKRAMYLVLVAFMVTSALMGAVSAAHLAASSEATVAPASADSLACSTSPCTKHEHCGYPPCFCDGGGKCVNGATETALHSSLTGGI